MPVIQVHTDQEFQQYVDSGKVIAVDYFGTWCGPCKFVAPIYEKLSNQYTNAVFLKVDIDELAVLAEREQIQVVPTFQVYHQCKKVQVIVGSEHIAQVEAKVKELLLSQ